MGRANLVIPANVGGQGDIVHAHRAGDTDRASTVPVFRTTVGLEDPGASVRGTTARQERRDAASSGDIVVVPPPERRFGARLVDVGDVARLAEAHVELAERAR